MYKAKSGNVILAAKGSQVCGHNKNNLSTTNLKYMNYPFTKMDNLNLRAMSVIRKEQEN